MEVYHINRGGEGYFKIAVQMPNNSGQIMYWPVSQVHKISSSFTIAYEIIEFTSVGATSGIIQLLAYQLINGVQDYSVNVLTSIPWNASSLEICNVLRNTILFVGYTIQCKRAMKDSQGQYTSVISNANQLIWIVTVKNNRLESHKKYLFQGIYSDGAGSFTQNNKQNYSDSLGGTFRLSLNGTQILINSSPDIPFNVIGSDIQRELRKFPGLLRTQIDRLGNQFRGYQWTIYYLGYNGDVPDLIIDDSGLTGGVPGSAKMIFETKQNYSTNFFVDTLDYRWMRTYSDKPNILVTVNDIPAVCTNDCSYGYSGQLPILTSVVLNGSILHFTMSVSLQLNISLTQIKIRVGQRECTNLTGTYLDFKCDLVVNGSSSLAAGTYLPTIQIVPFGMLDIESSFTVSIPIPDQPVLNETNLTQSLTHQTHDANVQSSSSISKFLIEMTFENSILGYLNRVPNSRHLLKPIFAFFANFDDLWLYNYLNTSFNPELQSFFDAIERLQNEKWETIKLQTLWLGKLQIIIQPIRTFYNNTRRLALTSSKFIQIEDNPNGYFLNTLQFYFSSFILLLLVFFVGNWLYKVLRYFNIKISYLFKSYSFLLAFPLFCLAGNIQFMAYLLGFDVKNLWHQNFGQKIHSFIVVICLFYFLLIVATIYFAFKYFYRQKASIFSDNCKFNDRGILYCEFMLGVRNFILGFLHFFIPEENDWIYVKPLLLLGFEGIVFVAMVHNLKRKGFFEDKSKQWMFVLTGFVKILLIGFLALDLYVKEQGNSVLELFSQVYNILLASYIILWLVESAYEIILLGLDFRNNCLLKLRCLLTKPKSKRLKKKFIIKDQNYVRPHVSKVESNVNVIKISGRNQLSNQKMKKSRFLKVFKSQKDKKGKGQIRIAVMPQKEQLMISQKAKQRVKFQNYCKKVLFNYQESKIKNVGKSKS